tara:strand:+ start:53 stop:367 length:315 start_codon:yes stop_codon:yes gene_type:complete
MIKQIDVNDLKKELINKSLKIIDVREDYEIKKSSIKGSVYIPLGEIPSSANKLIKEQKYAIICKSGYRSYNACIYLQNMGYDVINVEGGITKWAQEVDQSLDVY